jgi:hypothetical protein
LAGKTKNELFAKYNWNDQVKEDEMGRTCRMIGERMSIWRILVGKREGSRPLGRPKYR